MNVLICIDCPSFSIAAVFAWGSGNSNALGFEGGVKSGIKQEYLELKPRRLTALDNMDIKVVNAGYTHSAAIDGQGR